MSENMEGVIGAPADLSDQYEVMRFEHDDESGETRYFGIEKEVPVSEEDYMKAMGVTLEDAQENLSKKKSARTATAAAKKSTPRSGTTKKATAARKTSTTAKKAAATKPAADERTIEEEIEEEHPELSDKMKAFIASLVEKEVEKQTESLREENEKLKDRIKELEKQLEEAKKASPTADPDKKENKASEAEKDAMQKSGSPFRPTDKIKIDGQDGYHEVISIPYKDKDGDWRMVVLVNGQPQYYKVDDLKTWNPATTTTARTPAGTPPPAPAPTAPPAAPAPTIPPEAAAAQVRKPRGWFGRRMMTEEEWTTYRERYQGRNRLAVAVGALALIGGIAFGIWHIAEQEDIEATVHRIEANQHKPVKVVVVQKHAENPSKNHITTTDQPSTTTTEQPSTTTTEQPSTTTNSSGNNGSTTTTTPQSTPPAPTPETRPDNDEALSGTGTFFENSLPGGDGLQLDMQPGMSVAKNSDGTYSLLLPNGKRLRLQFRSSGTLTQDSVNAIEAEHYEVGKRSVTFLDREGVTRTHVHSVIGDKD